MTEEDFEDEEQVLLVKTRPDDNSNIPVEEFRKIVVENMFAMMDALGNLVALNKKLLKEVALLRKALKTKQIQQTMKASH